MEVFDAVKEALKVLVIPELTSMKTEIARIGGQLDATNLRVTDLHDDIIQLRQDMNAGFERVDRQFERMDQRIERLDQRFEELRLDFDTKLNDLKKEFDTKLNDLKKEFNELRSDLERKFNELRSDLERKFDQFRSDIDAKLDRIHSRIDSLYVTMIKPEEFHTVRQRLDGLERDVKDLKRASGL